MKLVIDPVTRIEGHLRVVVEVAGGKVTDAWSLCTLFRGFEIFLQGRDPMSAWHMAHRVCGVCPTSHGNTSCMGLEDAFGVTAPWDAWLVRNLMESAQILHSHVLWFYTLNAFDYVDVTSALKAKATTPSLKAVQDKLKAFVASGQLGFLKRGYWGSPLMKLPPELNLELAAHYLQALEIQAKAAQFLAVFGGKFPYHMTTPPGGVTVVPTIEDIANAESLFREVKDFVEGTMYPDLLAIAPYYLDLAGYGRGWANFLAWGVLEDKSHDPYKRVLPRGALYDGQLTPAQKVDPRQVGEWVNHSWYTPPCGNGRNPADGLTVPDFTRYELDHHYSWIKAARIDGKPMEVGPLARMLIAYSYGDPRAKKLVDGALKALGHPGQPQILLSNLGRIAARILEAVLVAQVTEEFFTELTDRVASGKAEWYTPPKIPQSAAGVGAWEAPRGALAHWNHIEDGKLSLYQFVPASNWNFAPRDEKGVRGPVEEVLIGTPVANPEQPLEVLRVLHTFDP